MDTSGAEVFRARTVVDGSYLTWYAVDTPIFRDASGLASQRESRRYTLREKNHFVLIDMHYTLYMLDGDNLLAPGAH
jgi:hypothetical protein